MFVLQELFVETIAKDAYVYAQQGKRKTLQRKDLGMAEYSVLCLAMDAPPFIPQCDEATIGASLSLPSSEKGKLLFYQ